MKRIVPVIMIPFYPPPPPNPPTPTPSPPQVVNAKKKLKKKRYVNSGTVSTFDAKRGAAFSPLTRGRTSVCR